jgi:hypothetical protein
MMEKRTTIPRPIFAKDLEIAQLMNRIRQDALNLLEMAEPARLTHYWQQLTAEMRNRGGLLPGDGKGGLIMPKKESDNELPNPGVGAQAPDVPPRHE